MVQIASKVNEPADGKRRPPVEEKWGMIANNPRLLSVAPVGAPDFVHSACLAPARFRKHHDGSGYVPERG